MESGLWMAVFTFLLIMSIWGAVYFRREEQRKALLAVVEVGKGDAEGLPPLLKTMMKGATVLFPTLKSDHDMEILLRHANRPFGWNAQQVEICRLVFLVGAVLLSFWVTDTHFLGHLFWAGVAAVIGRSLPLFFLRVKKTERQTDISRQWRNFLVMLSNFARTGMTIEELLPDAILATSGFLREVLGRMQRHLHYKTIVEGFEWLKDEVGLKEVDDLCRVVSLSDQNGTSIADDLYQLVKDYDDQKRNEISKWRQAVSVKIAMTIMYQIYLPVVLFGIFVVAKVGIKWMLG